MKNLIIACLLTISVLTIGCGGGGGSSTTPAGNTVTPTIASVVTENLTSSTVATITGSGFGSPLTTSYVTYDGQKYNYTTWIDTQILITVPFAAADPQKFRVVVGNVTSNIPVNTSNNMKIYNITPSSGNPGTVVTISGLGFGASQVLGAYVTFYDLAQQSNYFTATVTSWSDSSITCIVPANITLSQPNSSQVGVTVWKSSTTYVSSTFNLILPSVPNVDPTTDNVAATITLYGSGYGNNQGASSVRIGGNYAPVVSWNDTTIRVKVPDFLSAGAKAITLTINNKTYTNNDFSVAAPLYTSLTYPGGDSEVAYRETLLIYGRYFGDTADFDNSTAIRNIQVQCEGSLYTVSNAIWSDTQVSFSWPVPDSALSDKEAEVTINVGGLSTKILRVQAD